MRGWILAAAAALLALMGLVAWGFVTRPPTPTSAYRAGALLKEVDFSQSFMWEAYQNDQQAVDLRVADGEYVITAAQGGYIWGLTPPEYDNVVIEVEAVQRSSGDNNAYGVMCRADPANSGSGYYFLISGDGFFTIRRRMAGRGAEPLVEFWWASGINQGQSLNRIRVVCVDDYLGLYVNDRFVGEAHDTTFSSGFVGLAAAAPAGQAVEIGFDNVRIYTGRLGNE